MAAKKRTTNKTAKVKTKALAARTDPPDPEIVHVPYLVPSRTGGVRVNEDTALTLGAVWACVRVISEAIAGLPWMVAELMNDGSEIDRRQHPLMYLFNTEPNSETPSVPFWKALIAHALTWGNGYAEIERDAAGRVLNLWQITPDRVVVQRINGRLIYEVHNNAGPPTFLESRDVFHVRGPSYDGLIGYSVIRLHARTIGLGISLEDNAASLFTNDTTPGGILTTDRSLSQQARENLDKSWHDRHGGPGNRRKVAILEEGLKWQQTGLPPEDAQLVEQRQLTPTDICRIFGVPPHKIGDLSRATFSNIEHQSIEFVDGTLKPWVEVLESEADVKLFGRNNRGKLITKIDLDKLKRGDSAAKIAFVKGATEVGLFSVNDGRRYMDLNPVGPDGDKRFVPLNMQLLENAGEMPLEPPTSPAKPPESEPEAGETPSQEDRLSAACMPVLVEACQTIAKREQANKHLAGDARESWLAKHREYVIGKLSAPAEMFAAIHTGQPQVPAKVGLSLFVDSHVSTLGQSWHEPYCPPDASTLAHYILSAAAAKGAA